MASLKAQTDVDIDLGDRTKLLSLIKHVPAAMRNITPVRKHNTGVYVTDIAYDAYNDMAMHDYTEAEALGYFKLDLLNVWLYNHVESEQHLVSLMTEPDWSMLQDSNTFKKLIHLSNHYYVSAMMPEPINSIPRLAMFLAIIRPAKKYLIGKTYKEIAEHVWKKEADGYVFRKSHAVAYAHLVVVHMNLLKQNPDLITSVLPE